MPSNLMTVYSTIVDFMHDNVDIDALQRYAAFSTFCLKSCRLNYPSLSSGMARHQFEVEQVGLRAD